MASTDDCVGADDCVGTAGVGASVRGATTVVVAAALTMLMAVDRAGELAGLLVSDGAPG